MLKIKEGIDLEVLRDYGFKTGKEWHELGERCMGEGVEYEYEQWHKFYMNPDKEEKEIMYTSEEYEIPMVQISIRTGRFNNDIYIDCAPCCTYHIGGSELDVVSDTLFELISDGLIERKS